MMPSRNKVATNRAFRAAAEEFSRGTDTYVRGRPDYPAASLDWLQSDLGLRPGMTVIELGAGTGKFTRVLTRTGATIVSVEPSTAMLERLVHDLPAVAALRGNAEAIPLAASSTDAVICAQSFHWFANAEAMAEIRRVLKPHGVLGLIWNVRDESVEWVRQLDCIMAPYQGDAPRYFDGEWRKAFPALGFGDLCERTFHHEHVGPPDQVIVDRIASVSFVAALDERARNVLLREVRALIAGAPALAKRTEVRMPYVTRAYWTQRQAEA